MGRTRKCALNATKNSDRGVNYVKSKSEKNCEPNKTKIPKRDDKLPSSSSPSSVASESKNNENIYLEKPSVNHGEHPLMNALIVDNLFGYLKSFELNKNIRQVCKLWRQLSLKNWRPFATVKLGPPTNSEPVGNAILLPPSSEHLDFWPIDEYWQRLQDPNDDNQLVDKPFRNYIFSGLNIKTCWVLQPILDDAEGQNGFWNAIRDQVISLTFEKCTFPGNQPEYFEKIVTERLPNLETLSISNITTSPTKSFTCFDKRLQNLEQFNAEQCQIFQANMKLCKNLRSIQVTGEFPMCFYMMLLNSPNIERLYLDKKLIDDEHSIGLLEFLHSQRVKLTRMPFPLKHLDVMGVHFFNVWLNITFQCQYFNFPLETLTATISNDRLPTQFADTQSNTDVTDVLIPLVHHGAKTLKIFKVFRPPVFQVPIDTPFPVRMESLKELHLFGNIVRNLDFLQNMRNLEVLHIDYECYDKVENMYNLFVRNANDGQDVERLRWYYKPFSCVLITPKSSREYGRLKHMKKCHLNCSFSQRVWKISSPVQVLAEWMPNLTTLETNLTKKDFRLVCQHLPNLEQLVLLYKSEIDDDAVTGLEKGKKERCSENITSFQKLKKFQLKQLCWGDQMKLEYRLSNASVYEGFLKMNSLETVVICASPKMTVVAETALKQHVPNTQVIRNYDNQNAHGDGQCCSIKRTLEDLGGCFD